MLGFEMFQAKETIEIKDMYDGRKHKFTKDNLYLGRYNNFGQFIIYDDNKDGCKFIRFRWCMGPRHPYHENYFNIIGKGQVSNKKVFAKILDIVTKKEYLEEGEK